jgi:hypothetical protein
VNDIVNGMNNTFNFTILWGRVGARHPQLGAFGQEEGPGGRVVKLTLRVDPYFQVLALLKLTVITGLPLPALFNSFQLTVANY